LNDLLNKSEADRKARFDYINELLVLLDHESQRAQAAEEGLINLEATFAVRQARRLGLIKIKQLELIGNSKSEKKGTRDK